MRFLFLGDVVGRSGRRAVTEALPRLRSRYNLNFVVVNGENAAGGFGITESILNGLFDAGADVVTLGNHAFDQRDALVFINRYDRLVRPLNFPTGTPGRGASLVTAANGANVLVINALGRVFMPALDCPFRAIDREVSACALGREADLIFVDFHAEATSEKQALGWFLDGRVTAVAGTHTHVPTADARVLAAGTAYQTDTGMCGDYTSVIGMQSDEPVRRFLTGLPQERFEPAVGEATVCGFAVDVELATGRAKAAAPLRLGGDLSEEIPWFWTNG